MITVRTATEADIPAMGAVYFDAERAALRESHPDGFPPEWFPLGSDEQAAEPMRASFFIPRVQRWVADESGVIVGFAVAGPDPEDPSQAELMSLYVRSSRWGTGAGAALMAAIEGWIDSSSFEAATLWTPKDNQRSRRFYERFGWVGTGEMMKTPGGMALVRYRKV